MKQPKKRNQQLKLDDLFAYQILTKWLIWWHIKTLNIFFSLHHLIYYTVGLAASLALQCMKTKIVYQKKNGSKTYRAYGYRCNKLGCVSVCIYAGFYSRHQLSIGGAQTHNALDAVC